MKNNTTGMTLIVKTVTRLTVGLIFVYGIYIMLQGHISPGGGFVGGLIIALSFVHLMLAFGKDVVLKRFDQNKCIFLSSLGALAFVILAVLNFIYGNRLFGYRSGFKLFSAGLIPLYDIISTVIVGVGFFAVFLALVMIAGERKLK
jgi:multicomponent Na+:H+ antiporter subunit B